MSRCTRNAEVFILAACVLLLPACGGAMRTIVWPPPANPSMDGLYPYDFGIRGLEGVKALHSRMLSTKVADPELEQTLLYALGRAQIDAFLYGTGLPPGEKEGFFADLGELLGVEDATEETFLADPKPLLEPLALLALAYPKGRFALAGDEARIVFHLFTREDAGDEEMAFIRDQAAGKGAISPFARAVEAVVIGNVVEAAAGLDPEERSTVTLEMLLPFAGTLADPEGAAETRPERLGRVLAWASSTLDAARKDPDPIFMELLPRIDAARETLRALRFPVGLPGDLPLPAEAAVAGSAPDPFRYVVVDASGAIRVATSAVLAISEEGSVAPLGGKTGSMTWPGREVDEPGDLPAALAEATAKVASLGPAGGSPHWDRVLPLVAHPDAPVNVVAGIIDACRDEVDRVLVGVRTGDETRWVVADLRPDCAMAGTRLSATLGKDGVAIDNVTVGDEESEVAGAGPDDDPLIVGQRVSEAVEDVLGRPQPDVFVEIARKGGDWSWSDLVAVHEGAMAALVDAGSSEDVEMEIRLFLLPGITLAESREIEKSAVEGASPLPDPADVGREEMVLLGAYGDHDEKLLDAWLSAWLADKSIDQAATVVLDVARCWGGDYKERAIDALSKGDASILAQVATYLGDPVMGDVASSVLSSAGADALPILVWKLTSRDEPVWTAAWTAISGMQGTDLSPAILPLMGSTAPEVRLRAIKLYVEVTPAGDHSAILPLMEDPDPAVGRWAIAAAGMLDVQEAIPLLLAIAGDPLALPEMQSESVFALGLLEAQESVPLLIAAAGSKHGIVRESAALALGNVGSPEVVPTLVDLLDDKEPTVVLNAVKSLGLVADDEAVQYLEHLLGSPHEAIAAEAKAALDAIETAKIGKLAIISGPALAEACPAITAAQLGLLAGNPAPEALDCLASKSKDADPAVREAACVALGKKGDPAALTWLKKRTKDKVPSVRQAAWTAIDLIEKGKKPAK